MFRNPGEESAAIDVAGLPALCRSCRGCRDNHPGDLRAAVDARGPCLSRAVSRSRAGCIFSSTFNSTGSAEPVQIQADSAGAVWTVFLRLNHLFGAPRWNCRRGSCVCCFERGQDACAAFAQRSFAWRKHGFNSQIMDTRPHLRGACRRRADAGADAGSRHTDLEPGAAADFVDAAFGGYPDGVLPDVLPRRCLSAVDFAVQPECLIARVPRGVYTPHFDVKCFCFQRCVPFTFYRNCMKTKRVTVQSLHKKEVSTMFLDVWCSKPMGALFALR